MSFSYYIASRLALTGKKTFSKTIVRLAIAGIAISVSVMISSVAILVGFKAEILKKVTGFGMHVQIEANEMNESYEGSPIEANPEYLPELKKVAGVQGVYPYLNKPAIIKTEDQGSGIILKGVNRHYDFSFIQKCIVKGRNLKFEDSLASDEILLSGTVARKLRLDTGDLATIFFLGERNRVRQLTIAGIFETGLEEIDNNSAIVDLAFLQKINGWEKDEVQGLEVKLDNLENLDSSAALIHEVIDVNQEARSVRELKPQIFDWLALLDTNVTIIIGLMAIVSTINMITALLILILERTNMIGLLKAMGSSNAKIKRIFLLQAAYIILTGTVIGTAVAVGFYYLQTSTGLVKLDAKSYYLDTVPVQLELLPVLLINAGSFLVCFVAMLLPVMLIVKISPVKAIKFD